MEALKYKWELRDNKHTVEMLVSNWADRIIKVLTSNIKDIEELRKEFYHNFVKDNGSRVEPSFRDPNGDVGPLWNWITENFVPKSELKYVTGADIAYGTDYTILPSQHDEKVFAYDEPKYAGWYCPKCLTVVYSASEKDIAEHKCTKGI